MNVESLVTPLDRRHSPAVRRFGANRFLSTADIAYLEKLQNNRQTVPAGTIILKNDDIIERAFVLIDGWAMRFQTLEGGEQHVVNVYLPGDFFGTHLNFFRRAIHDIVAVTDVELAWITAEEILAIHREYPILASGLDWSLSRSVNILSERNVSLGARPAERRILHFLLELYMRLLAVAEVEENAFYMPLTQANLADACGLSLVHTNKTLARLSKQGLATWQRGRVEIPDIVRSMKACGFDARFLAPFQTRFRSLPGSA